MTELSNAVTVLIARMESHPEDFEPRNKFANVADALYGMLGLVQDIPRSAYWFLTDADKEALTEAWKKYHRTAMDKEVMTKIFDEDYYKRQEEAKLYEQQMKQQMYQQQAAMNVYPYAQNSTQGMAIQGSGGHTGLTVSSNGAVNMANTLSLGGETIDSSLIKKLKALVK
jgi:hypothetical protein